jgi:hypothetical protein
MASSPVLPVVPISTPVQLVEITVVVNADGTVQYQPNKEISIVERLALIVFTLQASPEVTDAVFASTPFVWINEVTGQPRTMPAAVTVTRESDRVSTIFDLNVSESQMHLLPVVYLSVQNGNGGNWRYAIPTDPTIINREDPNR